MDISFTTAAVTAAEADLVAIPVHSDGPKDPTFKALDKALGGKLRKRAEKEGFKGKRGQVVSLPSHGAIAATEVTLFGIGDKADVGSADVRDVAAIVTAYATTKKHSSVAFALPTGYRDMLRALQLAAEGFALGTYRFDRYMPKEERSAPSLKRVLLIGGKTKQNRRALTAAIARGRTVAEAVATARDWVNEPAAKLTPTELANQARALAKKKGVTAKILTPKECEKLGMGMFLAVGRGSDEEERLIHLTYKPKKAAKKKIAIIGKGVTFDSGGYSLKPSASMLDMKTDMAGAAAVLAAIGAVAEIGSPYEVHAIAACTENMVSGRAYKLGDVLTGMDGTTVEIDNTDAEGRLTLGDAITYAKKKIDPDEMFDFATLTGACLIALGPLTAGAMSADDRLCKQFLDAAEAAGEDMWRLPLNERLREQLKSPLASMRNTGGRPGGAITAGLFLKHFAGDTPWVHVDIAGPASSAKTRGAVAEGGTGFAVATMVEYLTH